jgi:hypothetical protein
VQGILGRCFAGESGSSHRLGDCLDFDDYDGKTEVGEKTVKLRCDRNNENLRDDMSSKRRPRLTLRAALSNVECLATLVSHGPLQAQKRTRFRLADDD